MPLNIRPAHPTHAIKMVDNWDGEGDVVTIFAIKVDGEFYCYDSGNPVIEHVGDRIIKQWPLN